MQAFACNLTFARWPTPQSDAIAAESIAFRNRCERELRDRSEPRRALGDALLSSPDFGLPSQDGRLLGRALRGQPEIEARPDSGFLVGDGRFLASFRRL